MHSEGDGTTERVLPDGLRTIVRPKRDPEWFDGVRRANVVQLLRGGSQDSRTRVYSDRGRCAPGTNQDNGHIRDTVHNGSIKHTVRDIRRTR